MDYKGLNSKVREAAGLQPVAKHKLRRAAGGRKGAVLGTGVKMDLDTSAGVSSAAVASAGVSSAELRKMLQANAVRVIDLFREWDEDGDGTISRRDFARSMPVLGLEAPEAAVFALFDSFDPDGSGTIEYAELSVLLQQQVRVHHCRARSPYEPGVVGLLGWGGGIRFAAPLFVTTLRGAGIDEACPVPHRAGPGGATTH